MIEIKKFQFDSKTLHQALGFYRFGSNWPVVYILLDDRQLPATRRAYVGKSQYIQKRAAQHFRDEERRKLSLIYVVGDEDFHASATEDIESWLIRYLSGHQPRLVLLNRNKGIVDADYFDRQRYKAKMPTIWQYLQNLGVVCQNLEEIENSDLFKYSPYKALTEEQLGIVESICQDLKQHPASGRAHLIQGQPGTGKTVLASCLLKRLKDDADARNQNIKIGLVAPNRRLRESLKDVVGGLDGFHMNMVMSPYEVVSDYYDLLIVDEAHLLGRPVAQARIGHFRKTSEKLGLDPLKATQLDWVQHSSKYQVLLYDEEQAVRPANIRSGQIQSIRSRHHLNKQCRILGGQSYVDYVTNILNDRSPDKQSFGDYAFHLCNRLEDMVSIIQDKETILGLSRILAGWSWPWRISDKSTSRSIHIGSMKLAYRSYHDNVKRLDENGRLVDVTAEVDSIHAVQGYDLNYAGVIIGPDLCYDPHGLETRAVKSNYYDIKGKSSLTNESELDTYIKRIYRVLLTRAVYGTYVYICDPRLRRHWRQFF